MFRLLLKPYWLTLHTVQFSVLWQCSCLKRLELDTLIQNQSRKLMCNSAGLEQ